MAIFNSLSETFTRPFRKRFQHWLDRRIPGNKQHTLSHSNLFIFPTRQGFIFLLIASVLWVLGTNYQNNLILALVFFMVALLVVAIISTYSNLAKLKLSYEGCAEVFAGDAAQCRFNISSNKSTWADGIEFFWQGHKPGLVSLSIEPNKMAKLTLPLKIEKRGMLTLPRVGVQTVFPFGLLRCWTWLKIDDEILIYPSPKEGRVAAAAIEDDWGEGSSSVIGADDFSGLRGYVPGDAMRDIAWKALARGQGVHVKEFSQSVSRENWLDFDSVASQNIEERLSILCFWVLHYHNQHRSYGLRLKSVKFEPESGREQRERCLDALARFELDALL